MDLEAAGSASARRRSPRRLLLVVFLLAVLAGLALVSGAIFSDATRNEGMRLDVGTVDIATAPVTFELDAADLVPGDVVATPLVVRNDGSLELRYAITSTVDDAVLADELLLTIRTGVTACDAVGADAAGTLLAGPVRLGGLTGDTVLGDPARGQDPGDRVLAAGGSELLCFRAELPASATEAAAAGRTVSSTLRLDAEQTAVNP